MLRASGLTCLRGSRTLFTGVEVCVHPGQWLHVKGENGAGKTSLLRILAGLSQPAAGDICWDGVPIGQADTQYRQAMLYFGHHGALKEDLSALENLYFAAAIDGAPWSEEAACRALVRFGLRGREELPVLSLSAGQKRRVMLARLAIRKARLWILDEPFTALDVKAIGVLTELVVAHLAGGGMAVLTSHQAMPIAGGLALQL